MTNPSALKLTAQTSLQVRSCHNCLRKTRSGTRWPITQNLSETERNYEIDDKEMLAIIQALDEWQHFLEGAPQKFEIWTDHKNPEYFMTAKKLNCRQARWSLTLARFNFVMHHQPGKTMRKSDALSRWADHRSGSDDNRDITLLTPNFFVVQATEGLEVAV